MSETVQGNGTDPATPPTHVDSLQCVAFAKMGYAHFSAQVGMSPLMRCFWVFLVMGPGFGLFAVCLFRAGGPGTGVSVVVETLPWPGVYADHDARLQRLTWEMAKGQSHGRKGASQ